MILWICVILWRPNSYEAVPLAKCYQIFAQGLFCQSSYSWNIDMVMPTTFEILEGFLDHTELEVEGRALEAPPPPPTVLDQLRELARGKLPAARQKEVFDQLRQNRHWISLLADEVKV